MLERLWTKGNPLALFGGMNSKLIQPLWRTVWKFLEKLKVEPSYDPGASLVAQTVKNLPVV